MLQEALSTKRFGPAQERFPHLEALNGIQSVVCYIWAVGLLILFPAKAGAKVAPITAYLRPAISSSIGPACGILALRNISYPAQVLLKPQNPKPLGHPRARIPISAFPQLRIAGPWTTHAPAWARGTEHAPQLLPASARNVSAFPIPWRNVSAFPIPRNDMVCFRGSERMGFRFCALKP